MSKDPVKNYKGDLQPELVEMESLYIDPTNANKHDDKDIETKMSILQRFGQRRPIIVDHSGRIRAGNGIFEAAHRLGWKDIVVNRLPEDMTDAEAKAFAIADNRASDFSKWDKGVLRDQLEELYADDHILALATGWSESDLKAMQKIEATDVGDGGEEGEVEGFADPDQYQSGDGEYFTVTIPAAYDRTDEVREALRNVCEQFGLTYTNKAATK